MFAAQVSPCHEFIRTFFDAVVTFDSVKEKRLGKGIQRLQCKGSCVNVKMLRR